MRVLVTGDRNWSNKDIIREVLKKYPTDTILINGGARGADSIAAKIGKELGFKVETFKADWGAYGRAAGPIRNRKMLREGKPDVVEAFHDHILDSKGTKDMVEISIAANLPVTLHDDREGHYPLHLFY
jgi:hypothetical protein